MDARPIILCMVTQDTAAPAARTELSATAGQPVVRVNMNFINKSVITKLTYITNKKHD